MSSHETAALLLHPMPTSRGSPWGLGCVLVVQMLHGLSYYSVFAVSQLINIKYFNLTRVEVLAVTTSFNVICFVTNLVGGWYSDTKAGRYWAIFFANLINLIGTLMKTGVVITYRHTEHKEDYPVTITLPVYISAMMFMAVSRGFMLTSVVPFGAQQLNQSNDARLSSYFRWTILAYNLGKFLVFGPIEFIIYRYNLDPALVHTIVEFLAEGLSWCVLIIGKRMYVITDTTEGEASMKEITQLISKNILHRDGAGWHDDGSLDSMSIVARRPDPKLMTQQRLKIRHLFLMCGIFTTIGVFEAVYNQVLTTFIVQGKSLKGDHPPPDIPNLFMSCLTPLTVIVLIVLAELHKWCCTRRAGYRFLELKLIAVGTLFSVAALICADYIEIIWRLHGSECSKYCQVPQFILMGVADFLVFIPGFEFSYRESYPGLQSTTTGFFYGIGSFFALIVFFVFIPLGTVQIDVGKHRNNDKYLELFSSLAGLMLTTTIVILIPTSLWYSRVRKKLKDSYLDTSTLTNSVRHGTVQVTVPKNITKSQDSTGSCSSSPEDSLQGHEGESPGSILSARGLDLVSRFMEGRDLIEEREYSPSRDLGATSDQDEV